MKQKTVLAGFFALLLSLPLIARGVYAQEEVEVKIAPPLTSVGRHSHDHNITAQAVKRSKTEYMLQSKPEDSHKISPSRTQISDLLNGTTVIYLSSKDADSGDLKAHQHRVTITYKAEKEEASGW